MQASRSPADSDTEEEGDSPPKLLPLPQVQEHWGLVTMQRPSFPLFPAPFQFLQPHTKITTWFTRLLTRKTLRSITLALRVMSRFRTNTAEIERICREEMAYQTFRRKLTAAVQAWKTRRIISSRKLAVSIEKVRNANIKERPGRVSELIQVFDAEYDSGKWMKRHKKPLQLKKSVEFQRACLSTPEPLTTVETCNTSPQSARPFLKRRSKRVPSQHLDYRSVSTRINCWHGREVKRDTSCLKRNSLEEFVVLEQLSLSPNKHKLPIPQTQTPLRTRLHLGAQRVHVSELALEPPRIHAKMCKLRPKKD